MPGALIFAEASTPKTRYLSTGVSLTLTAASAGRVGTMWTTAWITLKISTHNLTHKKRLSETPYMLWSSPNDPLFIPGRPFVNKEHSNFWMLEECPEVQDGKA